MISAAFLHCFFAARGYGAGRRRRTTMAIKARTRRVVVVLAMMVLALAGGIAYAAGRPAVASGQQGVATAAWQACDRIHDSDAMQQLRVKMPAQARHQCDGMHQKMQHTAGQMMSGSSMTRAGMMSGR
jgi:hypothetical protein